MIGLLRSIIPRHGARSPSYVDSQGRICVRNLLLDAITRHFANGNTLMRRTRSSPLRSGEIFATSDENQAEITPVGRHPLPLSDFVLRMFVASSSLLFAN